MQDLRLVGVHDDGEHLLLSGAGGEMFQLPIDEALRVAASRTTAKAASVAAAAPISMSPRDIQARIRGGSTAAEVAELSGIPLAKVQRYEGPVLAEREYVAQQARKVEVAAPSPGHDVYRSVFGDQPALLGDMVAHRLSAHGIEVSSVEWDSWRRPDGSWNVVARFEAKPGGPVGIGEEPPAMWTFSPARKSLQNANRWAQQLSELEPLDGPVPARRLTAVSDRPFDFETDADAAARTATAQLQVVQQLKQEQEQESDGLLDMLRSRRGQRLGVDEDADDALAKLLTSSVPAAHPRPSEVLAEVPAGLEGDDQDSNGQDRVEAGSGHDLYADGGDTPAPQAAETEPGPASDPWERRRDGRPSIMSRLTLAPRHEDGPDDALKLHDGVSTETTEITIAASQLRPVGQQGPTTSPGLDELLGGGTSRRQQRESAAPAPDDRDADQPERQPAKSKRSSIPSWDEIVFGARGD
ncbi:septation protein SepH [Arthrobacter sp. U41]|uniref:septation protein SepH n=1 Tax=Arthrobacter sp. U41 TaxID=1849032 RepID=UPI0011AACD99|nr:septation protein SepH [Arthrobacter sp. U41]